VDREKKGRRFMYKSVVNCCSDSR